jgi:dTMP kinase
VSVAARGGRFVSFEGGEASGKSLQARRLVTSLREWRVDVVLVREPGGTPAGERIRDILLHASDVALSPEVQALLFSAARAQLVRDVIRPALERGAVVVADRYFDSTLAYQGAGLGAEIEGLRAITRFAVGDTIPDRTFFLDVPVDVILERSRAREADRKWDRFEVRERDFHERIRRGYRRLAAAEPGRFVVVKGDRDEGVVAAEILSEVDSLLGTITRR